MTVQDLFKTTLITDKDKNDFCKYYLRYIDNNIKGRNKKQKLLKLVNDICNCENIEVNEENIIFFIPDYPNIDKDDCLNNFLIHKEDLFKQENIIDPTKIEPYSYEFQPMKNILGYQISQACLYAFKGKFRALASILWEMTWFGYDMEAQQQKAEEELEICRKIIPANQYAYTLELTQGEEGDFYKQKLKDIAKITHKMTTNDELVNEDGSHNVAFHYFVGNSDFYISQLYPDGTAFGYTILNGDVEMAEWGYQNIEEIINVSQWIEMDYHVPEGMTIERMLEEKYPEYTLIDSPTKRVGGEVLDKFSKSDTIPINIVNNNSSYLEHEATVSKISDDELFYLMSRGLDKDKAAQMIVMGFIEPFSKELPMEYAVELNQLIKLEMKDSIG